MKNRKVHLSYLAVSASLFMLGYMIGGKKGDAIVSETVSPLVLQESASFPRADEVSKAESAPLESDVRDDECSIRPSGVFLLPKKFWSNGRFSPISAKLEIDPETADLLQISVKELENLQAVLDNYKNEICKKEEEVMSGGFDGVKSTVDIPAWNSDPESSKADLIQRFGDLIGKDSAEFLVERSSTALKIATGDFGSKARRITIQAKSEGEAKYIALVAVGKDVLQPMKEGSGILGAIGAGVEASQTIPFNEIPPQWKHLFTE